jgi:hypothetical protein
MATTTALYVQGDNQQKNCLKNIEISRFCYALDYLSVLPLVIQLFQMVYADN